MADLYANIIINISHEKLDRPFSYRIPENLLGEISPGVRVRIPFGASNKEISGYVLGITDKTDYPPEKIKSIIAVEKNDTLVEGKLIALAEWMRVKYGSTMINALKTVLPIKKDVKEVQERTIVLNLSLDAAYEKLAFYNRKHQVARYRLMDELIKENSLDYVVAVKKLNIQAATIKLMEESGVIKVESKRVFRNPVTATERGEGHLLNTGQQEIVDEFGRDFAEGRNEKYLIHGITGSGKTEVYMEMIDIVVKSGRQAIVLIPEISLTYQTVMRFYKRFGDAVSTLHSRLSAGEKYDQFERAKRGEIKVMIGPRSALFTPFDNLGLIVIDEEHESSYKSDNMPKYHAREVAEKLCEIHGASLVLGSATPSINSYYLAQNGKYKLCTLTDRAVSGSKLPNISVVDLREELKAGNKTIFSRELAQKIEECLAKKEQVMLFLNRRGLSGSVLCRACGETIKCPHCDVPLSLHAEAEYHGSRTGMPPKGSGKLVCHYCGYETANVTNCPSCGSPYIGGMGSGTQKIEMAIRKQFPYAVTLRMDYDTTRLKGSYDDILSRFANHEADILIGTQMIVKGHDFPGVTLMGILVADMSLNANDYRAAERTFQILVQAAGRAGRGDKEGDVVIQTYKPDHYSISYAVKQDYVSFYEEEMAYRMLSGYPPAGRMLAILMECENEEILTKYGVSLAEKLNDDIIRNCEKREAVMIGPCEAGLKKLNDLYRHVIYIKSKDYKYLTLSKDKAEEFAENSSRGDVRVTFDFDPLNGY